MDDDLVETIADGVATLRFNRPESANALSLSIFDGLLDAIPRLGRNSAVGAIVLTGTGRTFCAGGDVNAMQGRAHARSYDERVDEIQRKQGIALALEASPKVTIAAINGAVVGAGLDFAMACDLRVAARGAIFATGFAKMGLSGDFGGAYFLSRVLGAARAQELYLLGRKFSADEAREMGLITTVYESVSFDQDAQDFARGIAAGPTLAYKAIKQNFRAARYGSLADALAMEAANQVRLSYTDDHAEAVQAFKARRAPVFKGA